uniref:Uncharacterized protein n=1 Tax=Hanusia phi TaxID=3032 RepID=A0A7S0I271_9CRYP|mmetsp:Transcript_847/g.1835  ORF Transcript_847/g.1835 Transcript_847/m.1835 type:complete len:603 (+) Transcript_847:71-1879(+)
MHPLHVPAPIPDDDEERLQFLSSLKILDTETEHSFDRITEAASVIFKVPIALVSLVDRERQWFKSAVGVDVCQTHRDVAFCAHAILPKEPKVFIVNDTYEDERFKYSDLVLGEPYIRFYAGAPLVLYTDDGMWKLGTICIIDQKPRTLRDDEVLLLEMLGRLVVAEIELREKLAKKHRERIDEVHEGAQVWAKEMNTAYIGQVAHDLRTPLNSFYLGLQALSSTQLTTEQQGLIDTMEISAELMSLTCTKAIDHTKSTMGKELHAARAAFDIEKMLRKSEKVVLGYTHESIDVSYEFLIKAGVCKRIISDEDWVWQMLMNYLCNARKFTTHGYIRTMVSLSKSREGKSMIRFSVADTGIGVDKDKMDLLFKPFGQLQDFSGGTGLGLFSVREKAIKLGGACGVTMNEPKGTIFWFEIPYVPITNDEEGGDSSTSALLTSNLEWKTKDSHLKATNTGGEKIEAVQAVEIQQEIKANDGELHVLVVEDDVPTRTLMVHGLKRKGYVVHQAGNGEEGLEQMQSRMFHMVLCDIMMPVMDGVECVKRLRAWESTQTRKSQYICALSANTDPSDVNKCMGAGMSDFFPKPVKIPALLKHLEGKFMNL